MKTIRDPSQSRLFDPFEGVISEMGRRHIEDGWQSMFRDVILEQMPVERIGEGMHDRAGRPSAELYSMLGLLLIRDFKGWTVPEAHEAVLFRADIQYALNLEPGVEVSQRTIERYLARMQDDEQLGEEVFTKVTDQLLFSMEVQVKKQRLDSTHILSDMSNIGRARMIGLALKRFFAKVSQQHDDLLTRLPPELLQRYQKASDSQVFGDLTTSEKRRVALQQAAEDLHQVITELGNVQPICGWNSFHQLQQIFSQQCEIREEFVEVRKKTGGDVIQNVSDPDATYCGNKGPGYQVQISETFNDEGQPNFITVAKVETAVESDADAVEPIVSDLKERDLLPEDWVADAGYGSDKNVEHAKDEGVTLVAPVPGGKKYDAEEVGYDEFELNDEQEVVACPAGHAPKSSNYNAKSDYTFAQMDADVCNACPLLEHCRVQRNKEGEATGRIQFGSDAPRAAQRRKHEQTEAYRDTYRHRSGIEATHSCLKRMMGLGRLRVRTYKRVKLAVLFKLTGWNIFRAVALRNSRRRAGPELAISH